MTVYNIDENLTPVLLAATHTCFMSHFADLGIGLDLEGAWPWPWPWSCYSLSWLQQWLLPVCKLVCACVCRAILLTMIITHWPRATLTCRSTIGLRTSPSHVDHTKLISYTYMHDIWRLRNADSMTPSMPSVISKIFSACLFVFVSNRLLLLMIGAHCTHTHTCLMALCSGLPGWTGTRKKKPIWILLKQETMSGSGISWAICKSAPQSRQTTTPVPYHSVFYRPDALPATKPTVSKHWRHWGTLPKQFTTQTISSVRQWSQFEQTTCSSSGMLPAIICSGWRWMFSSDVVCCLVRLED